MNNLTISIAEKLRKLRVLHNFTQLQLSEKINVSLSMYQRMESGKCNTVYHYLNILAEIYCVQESSFVDKDEISIVMEASHQSYQTSTPDKYGIHAKDKYELLENIITEKNRRIDLLEWIIKEKGIAI